MTGQQQPPPRRPGGLGRGLGALIPTAPVDLAPTGEPGTGDVRPDAGRPHPVHPAGGAAPAAGLAPVPGAVFAEVPLDRVVPNRVQPRTVFDPDALAELVDSIREVGLLQPVVVRALPGEDRFELVMGERRFRAATALGLPTIPAIVRQTDDDDMLRDALLENLHRSQLNPLEEAAAYQQLLADFGCTQEELARRIGRSRPQISNTIRLMQLPPTVQNKVAAGVLSAGHARALLGLPDAAAMDAMAHRIVAEGLSVRSTEELVQLAQGERPPRAGRPSRERRSVPVEYTAFADDLADRLETRVRVDLAGKGGRGKLVIDFASDEDLARIAAVLRPDPA